MITKKLLIEENEYLKEELKKRDANINYLTVQLDSPMDTKLQCQYMLLQAKYTKLLNSCLSKDTENITYNGKLYGIRSIEYHKDFKGVDTIHIEAVNIPREKGLINNLAEPFKNVAQELNKIFFGNDNE